MHSSDDIIVAAIASLGCLILSLIVLFSLPPETVALGLSIMGFNFALFIISALFH